MTIERTIRLLAGSLVLTSLALSRWLGPAWLLVAVFVGVNLLQSSLSGFCPAETILRRLGMPASRPARPAESAEPEAG